MPMLIELLPQISWECLIKKQSLTIVHRIVCGISRLCLDVELRGLIAIDELY